MKAAMFYNEEMTKTLKQIEVVKQIVWVEDSASVIPTSCN